MPASLLRFAAVMALGTALVAPPALADDFTVTGISSVLGSSTDILTIPSVQVTGGNIDEATIGQIFSGGFAGAASKLAALDATSIRIPVMVVSSTKAALPLIVIRNIELADVNGGVAGSIAIGGVDFTVTADSSGRMDMASATDVNIAGLLGIYGLVDLPDRTTLAPIYSSFSVGGGTVTGPKFSCTVKPVEAGALAARPLRPDTLSKLMAMSGRDPDEKPGPGDIVTMVATYADLITAYSVGASHYDGLDCKGEDPTGKPAEFGFGRISLDATSPGRSPRTTYTDIAVKGGNADVSFGSVTLKPLDFSGPLAAVAAQGEGLGYAWIVEHARELIPAFEGLSFSDVAVDAPVAGSDDRVKVTLKGFDLALADYVNGIPSKVGLSIAGLHTDIPPSESNAQLIALGYEAVDVGGNLAIHWNKDDQTIVLEELSTDWTDATQVRLTAVLGQAGPDLFSSDPQLAMRTVQGLTLRSATLEVTDAGLLDKAITMIAAQQQVEPPAFRVALSGMAQGTAIVALGGSPDSLGVAQALADFINGAKAHVSLTATALDPAGVPLVEFQSNQTDPKVLMSKLRVTVTPVAAPAPVEPAAPAPEQPATPADAAPAAPEPPAAMDAPPPAPPIEPAPTPPPPPAVEEVPEVAPMMPQPPDMPAPDSPPRSLGKSEG